MSQDVREENMEETVRINERHLLSKEIIDTFRRRLNANLHLYFPGLDPSDVKIRGTALGGPYSQTFKFNIESRGKEYTVYIKICPLYERLNPAKFEYETLQLLHQKMPKVNKDCAVARPLDYFSDLNAYVMESVSGDNLKTSLLRNNSIFQSGNGFQALQSSIFKSALWLKTFHQITRSDTGTTFNASLFLDSIGEDFDYRLLRGFRFKVDTLNRLDRLFAKLSRLNGAYVMPCAKWHWDYTPGHIYLENDRISVIDILGLDNAPIYEDIGHFLVAVTIVNNVPFYPFFDRKRAGGALCAHFLDAYLTGSDLKREEFYLFSKIYMLKYLIFYFGGQYTRVSEKVHPVAGKLFANLRSVTLTEAPMVRAIEEIERMMNHVASAGRPGADE